MGLAIVFRARGTTRRTVDVATGSSAPRVG
jgi:hypothetical protein